MKRAFSKLLASVVTVATASSLALLAFPSVAHADTDLYAIESGLSGKCLQPAPGDLAQSTGDAIVEEPCNGNSLQQWGVQGSGHDINFENEGSGWCLDALGGATDGTRIVQWNCEPITNQNWGWGGYGGNNLVSWVANTGTQSIFTPGVANGTAVELYASTYNVDEDFQLVVNGWITECNPCSWL